MQEYLSNEFSFGSQQITTRATLGSVAVWVQSHSLPRGRRRRSGPDPHMPRK